MQAAVQSNNTSTGNDAAKETTKVASTENASKAATNQGNAATANGAAPAGTAPAAGQPGQPLQSPFPSASLYVGDLNKDVTEATLFEVFNNVGPVASMRVCRDTITRRSLGYAYVNYHNAVDAERALDTLNGTPIKGRPCRIMWCQRDPSLRKSGKGNIFIKNLDKSIDQKTLYDTFSPFGTILSCKVASNEQGSKGYGFVHYETKEMADRAIEKVNGMMLNGKQVYVGPFQPRAERKVNSDQDTFTNVYIKNLSEDLSEEDFLKLVEDFGAVTSHVIMRTPQGKSRGFGFVNFEDHEGAKKCVDTLNGKEHQGKTLVATRAQKKSEREASLRAKFEQMRLEREQKWQAVNLYVKNLEDTMDDEKLREEFSPFGAITSAKVMRDDRGKSKGFAFVCFSNPDEASKAIAEMNGRMIGSKPLYVALAQRKETRRAQLEAIHAQRNKAGAPPFGPGGHMAPHMAFPPGAPSMFYPQQQFLYPQQMMAVAQRNRWQAPPQAQYQPIPNYMLAAAAMQQRQPRPVHRMNQAPRGGGRMAGRREGGNPQAVQLPMANAQLPNISAAAVAQQQAAAATQAAAQQEVTPEPLSLSMLSQFSPEQQSRILGERLYPLIVKEEPQLAGKITGMLLDRYNGPGGIAELIHVLESKEVLEEQINEALQVLKAHQKDEN